MRKTFTSLLLLAALLPAGLLAQSADEARQAAETFLAKRSGHNVSLQAVTTKSTVNKVAAQGVSDVHLFNAEGGGFAIVCSANGRNVVAGYSDSGTIDAENMPPQMREWLNTYRAAVNENADDDYYPDPTWKGEPTTPVAPLIKTTWGQGAPFNGKCPALGQKTTMAGSVPVALAQVLNFYRSSNKGTGTLTNTHVDSETETTVDFSTVAYDWDNMLDSYDGDYTQTQADAVAQLISDCGVASKVSYGYAGSTANIPFVALNKYYNFECMYVNRDIAGNSTHYYLPTQKWMQLIQEELQAGRPIIYYADNYGVVAGWDILDHTPIASCFIVDGIDADNYVHVNWGWGGTDNGYYDLALLNPSFVNFSYYEKGFMAAHEMILGIQPRTGEYEEKFYQNFICADWKENSGSGGWAEAPAANPSKASSSNNKMYFWAVGNTYDATDIKMATALVQDGQVIKRVAYQSKTYSGFPSYSLYNLYHIFTSDYTAPDGTYEVRLGYYDANSELQLCPIPEALIPTVEISGNGTNFVFHGIEGDGLNDSITIEDITPASEMFGNTTFYLKIKAKGRYGKWTKLLFENTETGKQYMDNNGFKFSSIYDDYSFEQSFAFAPKNTENSFTMPAGTYKILLQNNDNNITLAKDFYITLNEKPAYPVLDGSLEARLLRYGMGSTINAGTQLENSIGQYFLMYAEYANKITDPITVNLYAVNTETGAETFLTTVKDITPDNRYLPLGMDFATLVGKYRLTCRYVTPDGERTTICPKSYYQKDENPWDWYYEFLEPDSDPGHRYTLVNVENATQSASAPAKSAGNAVSINAQIKVAGKYGNSDFVAKAMFFCKEKGEVVVDSVMKNISVYSGDVFSASFNASLPTDDEYLVRLYVSDWAKHNSYYLVETADREIAEFYVNKSGLTGISTVTASNSFADGETVSVYTADGVLMRSDKYSAALLRDLKNLLPRGVYVLRSAGATRKVAW